MQKIQSLSIVFQGIFNSDQLQHIRDARVVSDDVIFSTWQNLLSNDDRSLLLSEGVSIIEQPDPCSIEAYQHFGYEKYLNLNRQIRGGLAGIQSAKNTYVIRTRPENNMNYGRFFEVWRESGKRFGALNTTTTCPARVLGYPYLFHISDHAHVGRKTCFTACLKGLDFDETKFKLPSAIIINDMLWRVSLSIEQIYTLILSEQDIYDEEIGNQVPDNEKKLTYDRKAKSTFCNIDRRVVDATSLKYRGITFDCLVYTEPNFQDNRAFKISLRYLISVIILAFIRLFRKG